MNTKGISEPTKEVVKNNLGQLSIARRPGRRSRKEEKLKSRQQEVGPSETSTLKRKEVLLQFWAL